MSFLIMYLLKELFVACDRLTEQVDECLKTQKCDDSILLFHFENWVDCDTQLLYITITVLLYKTNFLLFFIPIKKKASKYKNPAYPRVPLSFFISSLLLLISS